MSKNHRSVLITGCSSGIGLCAAQTLKERGYHVLATARGFEDVEHLRGLELDAHQLDLADSESINMAMRWVEEKSGGELYALFNNGAYGLPGAVEDLSRSALREQFETNLFGTHELTTRVLRLMRKQGYGRIIQNSSVLGLVALRYRGAYSASKFALEALSDALRLELSGTEISVSIIEPGPIETCFRENAYKAYQRHIDKQNSYHQETYKQMEARLEKKGPAMKYTLPPSSVVKALVHALESKTPKSRYPVTFPTYVAGWLRRILPSSVLDRVLYSWGS